jgi:hypothetical protein
MKPRERDEHRQFDFWLGDWDVYDATGRLAGRNRIRRTARGRALREEWLGVSGLRGTSLNTWSAATKRWHQTWVDSSGTLLLLDGVFRDEAMVLEGTTAEDDVTMHHRISWSLIDGDADRLRQHWETSADGSAWESLFDGRYVRRQRKT